MTLAYYGSLGQGPSGHVTESLACVACGADLVGLHVSHRCSQCGLPAGRTAQPKLLHFAPPGWLKVVRNGLRIQFWGTIVLFGLIILITFGAMAWTLFQLRNGAPQNSDLDVGDSLPMTIAMTLVGLIGNGVLTYGAWLMTAPEPGPGAWPTQRRNETRARFLLIASLVSSVILIAIQSVTSTLNPPVWVRVYTAIESLIHAAGFLYLLLATAGLAARVPDVRMAARLKSAAWIIAVSFALYGMFGVFWGEDTETRYEIALGLFVGAVGIVMLAFYIIYLVALYQLSNRFKQAMAYSEHLLQQPLGVPAIAAHPMPEQEPLP